VVVLWVCKTRGGSEERSAYLKVGMRGVCVQKFCWGGGGHRQGKRKNVGRQKNQTRASGNAEKKGSEGRPWLVEGEKVSGGDSRRDGGVYGCASAASDRFMLGEGVLGGREGGKEGAFGGGH